MDGAIAKEEAAARWQRDLEEAEADSRQSWPMDITARMSEFERLTLITEILMSVFATMTTAADGSISIAGFTLTPRDSDGNTVSDSFDVTVNAAQQQKVNNAPHDPMREYFLPGFVK